MLRRLIRREDGYVLPMVLGLGLVLILVTATALSSTSSGNVKADTEADWNAALAAAYAGIEDYASRLENDPGYVRYGNTASDFSDGSNALSLPTGANANPAFDVAVNGAWAVVPGSDGAAKFRYEVSTARYPTEGIVRLRATGLVGESTRSVIADLRQEGFSDFVYFTDYEVQDPLITPAADDFCEAYKWVRPSSCSDITFVERDTIDGKVHSNDRMLICEAHFTGSVTTANPNSPLYATGSGCGAPDFQVGPPRRVSAITMPETNAEMKKETRNDIPTEVADPGCLYTGPTVIQLNSNGTMTVWSPFTKKTQVAATAAGASTPAKCGAPGTGAGQLGNVNGATIPVLDLNLLFVQNVPNLTSDPNYTATSTSPTNFICSGSGSSQAWRIATSSTATPTQKFPMTDESIPATSTSATPAYGCRNGDLYVKGTTNGRMTVAAENYVYITGDLLYADSAEDMLGVVGQNAIWIYNPMKTCGTTCTALLPKERTIKASLLSVKHTIQVQNWDKGVSRGTLNIVGSMAQKFRGTVGTGNGTTGYAKYYKYDARLTYSAPPKYLVPTSTTFSASQIAGVPAAFTPDGTAR